MQYQLEKKICHNCNIPIYSIKKLEHLFVHTFLPTFSHAISSGVEVTFLQIVYCVSLKLIIFRLSSNSNSIPNKNETHTITFPEFLENNNKFCYSIHTDL